MVKPPHSHSNRCRLWWWEQAQWILFLGLFSKETREETENAHVMAQYGALCSVES